MYSPIARGSLRENTSMTHPFLHNPVRPILGDALQIQQWLNNRWYHSEKLSSSLRPHPIIRPMPAEIPDFHDAVTNLDRLPPIQPQPQVARFKTLEEQLEADIKKREVLLERVEWSHFVKKV